MIIIIKNNKMKIPLEHLNSFIAAADYGSFSAAGRELNKTQAAISLAIQNLEIDLGFSLFDRGSRYPTLTHKGEHVLKKAKLMMLHYDEFVENSKSIYKMDDIKINVGIDPLVCGPDVIKVISDFCINYPEVELSLVQQSSKYLINKINENKIDLALGLFGFSNEISAEIIPSFYMKSSWVASPEYLDNNDKELNSHDLSKLLILLPCDSDVLGLDEFKNLSQQWHIEDIHTLLSLCRNGLGISCLPDFSIKHDIEKSKLKKISFSFNKLQHNFCQTSIICQKSTLLSPTLSWLQKRFAEIEVV